MIVLKIDGAEIQNLPQLHQTFAETLSLPGWYGKNFDALYDCLNDYPKDILIRIAGFSQLKENLGRAADVFSRVLTHEAMENPKIQVEYID